MGKGKKMREVFNPHVSNINTHLDRAAAAEFRRDWPEAMLVGQRDDSRHSPVYVAMKDLNKLPVFDASHRLVGEMENTEANRHTVIADCDINRHWSSLVGIFRDQVRGWFCEIAASQAIMHQHEEDYPDTGLAIGSDGLTHYVWTEPGGGIRSETIPWWQFPMSAFVDQVQKHCHECSVPLRGYGELAQGATGTEQVSATHATIYKPKVKGRAVEVVTELHQINPGRIERMTAYLQNAKRR